jgi:hypothetical protein
VKASIEASTVVSSEASTVVMQKNTTVSEVSTAVKTGTKSVAGVGAVSRLQQVSVDRISMFHQIPSDSPQFPTLVS